jgi:hypothetical protein
MVDSVFIVESQSLLSICILRSLIFISCCVNLASLYGRACECDWKELVSMQDYGQLLIVHCQRITQTLESYVCIHPRHVAQNHRIIESSLTFISLSFCRAIKSYPISKCSNSPMFSACVPSEKVSSINVSSLSTDARIFLFPAPQIEVEHDPHVSTEK